MGAKGVRFCGSDVSSVRSSPEVGMTGRKHRQIIQNPIWFKQRDGYFKRLAPAASNHACNNHQSSFKDLSVLGFFFFFFFVLPQFHLLIFESSVSARSLHSPAVSPSAVHLSFISPLNLQLWMLVLLPSRHWTVPALPQASAPVQTSLQCWIP